MDEDVFVVSFKGNRHTKKERVADFTLLRCAELTLEHEFQFFEIIQTDSLTSNEKVTFPSWTITRTTTKGVGKNARSIRTTKTVDGQTYTFFKSSASNIIACYKEEPVRKFVYNAEIIYKSITEKYGIKKSAK